MTGPYISHISIENFRNLHGLVIDLPQNAVIVGENRAGKTNLLHALRLVLDGSLPDSRRFMRAEDFWDGLATPFAGNQILIRMSVRGFDGDDLAEAILQDYLTNREPLTATFTYVYRPRLTMPEKVRATAGEADYEFRVYGGIDETRNISPNVRNWLTLTVLPAMRDAEDQLQSSRRTILRPIIDRIRTLISPSALADATQFLDDAADTLLGEAPLQVLQTHLNEKLVQMVGTHQAVATKFGFAESDPQRLLGSLRLFLQETKMRALSDASLGTANLIFLCLLLQDLDDRLATRKVASSLLAIEEPEAHLHPHLQRLLFRYALRRNHSVLVTTHSPHIVSVSPLTSILNMRRLADGTSRISSVGQLGLSSETVDDLERYLDVSKAEVVFSRGVLFVEGTAEQYLVPTFARFAMEKLGLGSSLDEIGVTVCSVGGTDFLPFWQVTSNDGWNIPRAVITDGDPATDDPGVSRGLRLLGRSPEDFFFEDSLHEELANAGIFVGHETLELDLLEHSSSPMIATYADLASPKRTESFRNAIAGARSGDAKAKESVLARIEELGKGRYAQRLASHITAEEQAPPHISRAIAYIFKLLGHA